METVTMSSKGQVVIPKSVRTLLNLSEGEKFTINVQNKTIILTPSVKIDRDDKWQQWQGILQGTNALQEHVAEHAKDAAR